MRLHNRLKSTNRKYAIIRERISQAMKPKSTELSSREKLFRAAAILFSTKGFREVSVREIAAHANVNSALVGYYFHGKQALFNEVYRAHALPLSKERMKRLAFITKDGRKPSVEEILSEWLVPWLRPESDPAQGVLPPRLTINITAERWKHSKKAASFVKPTFDAFIKALKICLPHLSKETLIWRLHFLTGAITAGLRGPQVLVAFSDGLCDPTDMETTLAQILPYAVQGFCAPEPSKAKRKA
jgi:AcrR family transcriptional regulator